MKNLGTSLYEMKTEDGDKMYRFLWRNNSDKHIRRGNSHVESDRCKDESVKQGDST